MRISALLVAFALMCAGATATAQSRPYDPKGLARYDNSYVQCEARFPEMAGHKDEAYLSLWRVTLAPKSAARLAQTRSSAAYKAERQQIVKTTAKPAAPTASSPFDRQCRGLWGEFQRTPKAKP
jgi:hypothetical protein